MAVYTPLTLAQIVPFLRHYALGELCRADGIAEGIENTNYLLTFSDRKAILTLFEKRAKREDLPFYVAFMAHLAHHGICCPRPYVPQEGEMIGELAGRPAVVLEFLSGKGNADSDPAHLSALGAEMARMHRAVADFHLSRENDFSPHRLQALYEKTAPHLDTLQPGLCGELAAEIDIMQRWPHLGLPQGVIHADLFPDNVFFESGTLTGVIDFYFAATDYFAYDLAIALNAWDCHEQGADALINAYHAIRPLRSEEREALPFLARGAALRFLLTRAHDWFYQVEGALVTPKDPMEYLRKWEHWYRQ